MPKGSTICERSDIEVNWRLTPNFIKIIIKSILTHNFEIAGALLFKDACLKSKKTNCDKKLHSWRINKGDESSVATPYSNINYHTHPNKCYKDTNSEYGWPSGEDMAQCLQFCKRDNLVHLVFTKEGMYVIKVNIIYRGMTPKQILQVENKFKQTHKFRSSPPHGATDADAVIFKAKLLNNFKLFLNMGEKPGKITPEKLWIDMANTYTPAATGPPIFNVKLIKYPKDSNSSMLFKTNSIQGDCHAKSFESYQM